MTKSGGFGEVGVLGAFHGLKKDHRVNTHFQLGSLKSELFKNGSEELHPGIEDFLHFFLSNRFVFSSVHDGDVKLTVVLLR